MPFPPLLVCCCFAVVVCLCGCGGGRLQSWALRQCVLCEQKLSVVPAGKPGEGRFATSLALPGLLSPRSIDCELPPQGTSRAAVTNAETPKLFILPLLPDQTPHRGFCCHVAKNLQRTMRLSLAHRFLSEVFLRDVAAAKISRSVKNFSSQMFS